MKNHMKRSSLKAGCFRMRCAPHAACRPFGARFMATYGTYETYEFVWFRMNMEARNGGRNPRA
jgi:hypothetical protein